MNKQLLFICLMTVTSFASLKAVEAEDAFVVAIALGDRYMAQAIYKYLPEVPFVLKMTKKSYEKAFGSADEDLKRTPTDEAAIKARFEEIMTAPEQPGTVLAAKFGATFTPGA